MYSPTVFPRFNVLSFNAQGLAIRGGNALSRSRIRIFTKFLRSYTKSVDVFMVQEAKYETAMEKQIEALLPHYKFFHNPLSTTSAGTFIAVCKDILKFYDFEEEVLEEGYTQRVLFTPKSAEVKPFGVYNAYIYNGDKERWTIAERQLDSLIEDTEDSFNYVGGDFNMAHLPEDYSGGGVRHVPAKVLDKLEELKTSLRVQEVKQDLHTRFCVQKGRLHSSRLDYIFTPISEAVASLYHMVTGLSW